MTKLLSNYVLIYLFYQYAYNWKAEIDAKLWLLSVFCLTDIQLIQEPSGTEGMTFLSPNQHRQRAKGIMLWYIYVLYMNFSWTTIPKWEWLINLNLF